MCPKGGKNFSAKVYIILENNGISINAGCYQGGLINVLSAEKDNRSKKHQVVNFGIGYKF